MHDGFEFVDHGTVPGENHMGEKFRFERRNTGCHGCEFGVYGQGERMPKSAGSELQGFCCNFPATGPFDLTPDRRDSVRLRYRDDDAELPSAGPERNGAEPPALTETNIGRPKVQERTLDMFPCIPNAEGVTTGVKTPAIKSCHRLTMRPHAALDCFSPSAGRRKLQDRSFWGLQVQWA